jgi:hypothetical protein
MSWTFLQVALKSPLSEFYCQKDFVLETLWVRLEEDYAKLGTSGDFLIKLDQTLHPDCLPSLNKEARLRIYSPKRETDRELGYQILRSQAKADPRLMDFFQVIYLLERPSQGELFNLAWNRLKELGGSRIRREVVLDELRKLDPLPDQILASLDETKRRAILRHFRDHFPEFLDFYASQCIGFYGGKARFPNGNPTMNCNHLMGSELGGQVLGPARVREFEAARKL